MSFDPDLIRFSEPVADALAAGHPVVALESTVIAHGLPHPRNLEAAHRLEAAVRAAGAEPATIAILGGRVCVGLEAAELEQIATGTDILKVSRAELAYALATKRPGATTVAATMICARLAGITVFATGGIGGVHRGAKTSFDISADLEELARTNVCVVCSGAKAILDLPRTLEVLETKGVPVVGFRTDTFPAFWSRDSGLGLTLRLDYTDEVARLLATRAALGLSGGVVIAHPVPEEAEIPAQEMEAVIVRAVQEATAAGITGKAVTPHLLSRIAEITGGRSLETNLALLEANARLAGRIAAAFAALSDGA